MKIEHKGKHSADRTELLKSPPTFNELIKRIKDIPNLTKAEKAFFAMAIASGARVTEICKVRQRDITFKYATGGTVPFENVQPWDFSIVKVNIVYSNLKNKKIPYKTASIIRNEVFSELFEWIGDRYRELGPNGQDQYLYPKGRLCAYWLVKKLGDNFFPHIFRHYFVSNLARDGVSPQIIKTAVGWSSLDNWNHYAHLSVKELEAELKKYYGDSLSIGNPNKQISLNTAMGALAAKAEYKERLVTTPKNQKRKISLIETETGPKAIFLSKKDRYIKNQLKKQMEPIQKVEDNTKDELLQVV